MSTPRNDHPDAWWRRAVIYEVYPRSFADADGDGEGDLAGLRHRLPYLANLGVDALWIAPWYPSPMADGGYDVSDYCDIHPTFGTLADADALLADAHALGLRVLIDLVANHTSEQHPWFRDAVAAGPGSAERARYFFRDGRGPDGALPPNNWISAFGSSAWTRVTEADGRPGQWYLHTFAPEQPDLDWGNEQVRADFDAILRFWFDRGIDGFRVDAVPAMAKVDGLPDADYGGDLRFASAEWVGNPHWDVDGVHDILRRFRALADSYDGDRVFVTEAVVNGPERLSRYVRPDEMHTSFNFDYVRVTWDAARVRAVVDASLAALAPTGAPATWVLSSHDETRHVTRFGRPDATPAVMGFDRPVPVDLAAGTRRARAAILLTLALPGSAYLYQGEELGLPEVEDLPLAVLQDPVVRRSGGTARGRDGCRVPLPWSGDAPPFGFAPDGVSTWLPQPPEWAALTAERQATDPGSMLTLYREALKIRREHPGLQGEDLTWRDAPADVLVLDRGSRLRCVVNLGAEPVELAGHGRVLLASTPLDGRLPSDAAAWLDLG
jgi:alpha-glucosidase